MRLPEPAGKLAEKFYDGVLSEAGWCAALQAVAAATDSVQALIIERDTPTNSVRIAEQYNVPADVMEQYDTYYGRLDPALRMMNRIAEGAWFHDLCHIDAETMRGSEFYQDFMWPHGYVWVVANPVLREGGVESLLSLQRMAGQPAYSEQELAGWLPLVPHIRRSVRIRAHLLAAAARSGVAERALDRLRIPLVVADETAQVLLVNEDAASLMRRRRDVVVREGKLRLRDAAGGRLEALLREACGRGGSALAGGLRLVPGQAGPLQLVATPMPPSTAALHAWSRPLALVLLHEEAQPAPGAEELLQALYRLTAAETRVAMAILRGATPAAAAHGAGSSVATVRTQLKAVFAKTGATGQPDLVRKLSAVLALADRG